MAFLSIDKIKLYEDASEIMSLASLFTFYYR